MATCNYIKAKKQNQSAMRAVIRYVSQDAKTLDENGHRYLSGINCIGAAAYDEFMATKNLYGKRSGVYYYHYEQSFAPGEIEDYDTAHKIGLRLAEEMFPGFEVLVGTHLDAHDDDGRQRVHNHFVINSVSYASGMKLDYGPYTIEKMRRISDRLCEEHALSVLPEFKQTFDRRSISTREYRAALKGDSWKFKAIFTIENAMTRAASKEDFIAIMESEGYSVTWTDSRKYITYTCPNGMKVRDNKLHESKFLKENMQYEFAIRQQTINPFCSFEAEAEHGTGDADGDGDSLSADRVRDPEGRSQGTSRIYESNDGLSAGAVREVCGLGIEGSDTEGMGSDVGQHQGMVGQSEPRRQELGEQYRTESAGSSEGEQRNSLTGWEDARAIFLSAEHRNGQSDGSFLGYDFRDEEVDHGLDSGYGYRKRVVKRSDLSLDEINSFFADERNLYDDMPFDEEDVDADKPPYQLQAEARNGNVYAIYRLARLYLDENNRFYNESIGDYYLEKAAKAGHSVAQYRMGKMFYYGIIYREDEYEAQKWLSESVGNGNKYADALLGKLYVESDLFGEFRNEGFSHLFNAERNGSEFAAYTLGKYYMEGKVVKKDIAKAIEHLEIASARGNMYADYRLAQIYLFEADIFDMEKALEYLNRSAHAGNESAALALTRMANNHFLAVATNLLDLVGSLASIESYRQPQDCTTMPISRKERKKHEWEQSM